jgi:DNA repair exonuclease SbcCD ATPase subunit
MKLIFESIQLENFLSFENAQIDLSREGFTTVTGINENPDDLATSNGSGKSSIWEGISWCLTGETIRGTKDVKRLDADEKSPCKVSLKLKVDNIEYEIIRTKDPSNLKVFINDEDKSGKGIRDTEKLLAEYLPDITSQLVGSVIILGQGLPQRFSNNTPSGRKDVLEKLSKSDFMISDLKERVSQRKSILNNNLRALEDEMLSLNTEQTILQNQITKNEKEIEQYSNIPEVKTEVELFRTKLQEDESNYNKLEDDLTQCRESLDNIQEQYNNQCGNHYQELETLSETKEFKWAKKLAEDVTKLQNTLTNDEAQLKKLQSITDICPTCGQKLIGVEKPDTTNLEREINEVKLTLKSTMEECDEAEAYCQNIVREKQNVQKALKEDYNSKRSEYNEKISNIESEQRIIKKAIDRLKTDIADKQSKIDIADSMVKSLTDGINDSKEKLAENNEKILYDNNEKEEIESRLEIINKFNSVLSRDFRGYLLTNIISFINRKSKEYCNEVFQTDKLDFSLAGNNISISYDNKEYENLSGGEKQKVDLIVQLAIRDMLCNYLNFSSNIIVLDELFDNLDNVGCQRVLNLISSKLSDVNTIFIITHHDDISIPSDNQIVIVKGADKISRIK